MCARPLGFGRGRPGDDSVAGLLADLGALALETADGHGLGNRQPPKVIAHAISLGRQPSLHAGRANRDSLAAMGSVKT